MSRRAKSYSDQNTTPYRSHHQANPSGLLILCLPGGFTLLIRFFSGAQSSLRPNSTSQVKNLLNEAQQNPLLYESPEISKLYHEWETKNSVRKSFSSEVIRLLDESGTPYVDFYKRAWLDKKMFYKIKSDYGYKPSMETAVKCCFGLRLNKDESIDLLKLAGYTFSPSSSRDLALEFCIEHGVYNLREVNYLLNGLGERVFE